MIEDCVGGRLLWYEQLQSDVELLVRTVGVRKVAGKREVEVRSRLCLYAHYLIRADTKAITPSIIATTARIALQHQSNHTSLQTP